MRTLAEFIDKNKNRIISDKKAIGFYSEVAFYQGKIGAFIYEIDDKICFRHLEKDGSIISSILNPNDIEVVSEIPLGLKFIPGNGGSGHALHKNNFYYKTALEQLSRVGLIFSSHKKEKAL